MKNYFYNYVKPLVVLCALFTSSWFISCESFVEVDRPSSQLNAEAVFQDKASAEAALINIYARLRESGMFFGNLPGLSNTLGNYTDELTFYGGATDVTQQFYNNNVLPDNATVGSWWNEAYNLIYAANAILEGTAASTALTVQEKNTIMGEARFLRAMQYFYLAGIFGDIPYIITTDYNQNSKAKRLPIAQIYENIIGDLTSAVEMLPEPVPTSRIRVNKATAMALLARVYLYNNQLPEAAEAASYIINNAGLYHWEENINNVFLRESTETIWHLMPRNEGQNTHEGAGFIFLNGPPSQVALSNHLIEAFEQGDLRKENWTKAVSDGQTVWYHPNKYKERTVTTVTMEYSVVLRLSEQYLIRAEARALQGDLIGAKQDLDEVRQRAGLAGISFTNPQELLDAIQRERRVEFFTEFGHRFFDLKRTAALNNTLQAIKTGWQSTDRLFPIPEREILLNPNVGPQNPGY